MNQSTQLGWRWAPIGVGVFAMVAGALVGGSYAARLSDHRGNHLVPVVDSVGANRDFVRPRHLVVVVADGLRADAARAMQSFAWLKKRGTCGAMDVGSLTRSRPIYALLSTGVEADRTGVRMNDDQSPVAAESIWQVARRFGLHVTATSGLTWWRELFPEGFDKYQMLPEEADLFAATSPADLSLIHPLYIDDAGHRDGAASADYAATVARLDRELQPFLERLDLDKDLVIFTADHGHTARGGHGSPAPELREVSLCLAGRGVRNSEAPWKALDARTLPALVAVIAGVPFPKHLAADGGEDSLYRMFDLLDPARVSPAWLAQRRQAVDARREANQAQLEAWLHGPPGTWARLAHREQKGQLLRGGLVLLIGLTVLGWLIKRSRPSSRAVASGLAWAAVVVGASYLATILCRGRFDAAGVKSLESFIAAESTALFVVLGLTFLGHLAIWRDVGRLLVDAQALVGMQAVLYVAHLFAFGWPIGYPLPPSQLLFAPYPLALLMAGTGCFLVGATALRSPLARAFRL